MGNSAIGRALLASPVAIDRSPAIDRSIDPRARRSRVSRRVPRRRVASRTRFGPELLFMITNDRRVVFDVVARVAATAVAARVVDCVSAACIVVGCAARSPSIAAMDIRIDRWR